MTQHAAALVYPCGEPPAPARRARSRPACTGCACRCRSRSTTSTCGRCDDGDGWAIVDTGLQTDETAHAWREAVRRTAPLAAAPVTRVFVTHMHPDHIGMAGWLTRKFDCRLWMTRLEYLTCRVLVADTGREAPDDGIELLSARRLGRRRRSKTTARASAASAS